jgi:glyoxylase-like metal-dependent hydrolase (beta-lactamase superfamily II)
MDDHHRLGIPTPFDVGRVNCYVIAGSELTLVDPGPSTEAAYEKLSAGLGEHGRAVADVDRVLITHPHMDHFGLANRVVEASGARAVAHRDAAGLLADPETHLQREQAFFEPFLEFMGVPDEVAETAITLPEAFRNYQEPLELDRELTDGENVGINVDLTAVHTLGHAPGSVCFVDPTGGFAYTGDHVLPDTTPNPLVTIAPNTDDQRTRSLPGYLDSLEKLSAFDAGIGYGGHGDPISDLPTRIREILDHHHDRRERVAGLLAEMGPTTAHDLMQRMFPELPATEVFPGISEVVGHLDLLEDAGRVEITEENGIRLYDHR